MNYSKYFRQLSFHFAKKMFFFPRKKFVNIWINWRSNLKVHRSDLHFSSFQRVAMSFPMVPNDTHIWVWNLSVMIGAVQVRVKTVVIPPGSFEELSTVFAIVVIILIFGWKWVSTMIAKRITSGSLKKNKTKTKKNNNLALRYLTTSESLSSDSEIILWVTRD